MCWCVTFSSAFIIKSSPQLISFYKHVNIYIYTTNLLPLASAHWQAVLTGENHSFNGRALALGVPAHCAWRYRRSPRLRLPPCFLSLLFPSFLLASTQNRAMLTTKRIFFDSLVSRWIGTRDSISWARHVISPQSCIHKSKKKPLNCLSYQTLFSVLYGVCLCVCVSVCMCVCECVCACVCVFACQSVIWMYDMNICLFVSVCLLPKHHHIVDSHQLISKVSWCVALCVFV